MNDTELNGGERQTEYLAQRVAFLESILKQIPSGVVVAEAPSGRLVLGNEQVDRIWRQPFIAAAEVGEYSAYRGFHADGRPYGPEEWPLARAIRQGEMTDYEEIEFLRGDGTRGVMVVRAAPVCDSTGRVVAAVSIFSDVTEQRETELSFKKVLSALKENDERLQQTLAAARMCAWDLDVLSGEVRQSANAADVWGKQLRTIDEFYTAIHPDDLPSVKASLGRVLDRNLPYDPQFRIIRADTGEVRWMADSGHSISDGSGTVVRMAGVIRDITDQRRMEDVMFRSHLLEQVSDAIIAIDNDMRVTFWNGAAERIYGVPAAEVMSRPLSEFFDGELPPDELAGYERSMQTTGVYNGEAIHIVKSSGARIPVEVSISPVCDATGARTGTLATVRDISLRRRAELEKQVAQDALLRKEMLLRKVMETLPVGVWITDEQGVIREGNPAGQRIWAGARYVGPDEFLEYKGWWVSTGKRIAADEWAVARAVRYGETSVGEEIEIEAFDGTHKIMLNSAAPLYDDAGRFMGAIVVNEDVTRLKETERELLASREQLRMLSRRLVELHEQERYQVADELYNEIGQLIAALKMQLGALARRLGDGLAGSAAAREEVRAMQELTEDALIRLHQLASNLRPVSLDKLGLAAALEQYAGIFGRQHGVAVATELSVLAGLRLPPHHETALYRIVQECLLNAVQHARPRAVSLLFVRRAERLIAIIEDDDVSRRESEAHSSGGLSLLAVSERVAALGGAITIESSSVGGTTILIDVPLPPQSPPAH